MNFVASATLFCYNFLKSVYSFFYNNLQFQNRFQNSYHKNRLILFPSGVPATKRGQSALRTDHNIPQITREQIGKIWQSRIDERRNVELAPANESS